jgi:mono/diheme cytochrome c family protein/glucose/arabinose dehydrogenase
MTRITIAALSTVIAATVATGVAFQQASQWPPALQPMPASSAPISPEEEMKTFFLPPGYHVELVASEPMIQDPILMDFDPDGRMWVIEVPNYMTEMNPSNEKEREQTGRIVVLEDTNNDGKMDKRTVFVDKLVLPRALKVLDRGVLVAEPPNLWLFKDDGTHHAGAKELVTNQYGRLDASIEHNANGLTWTMDNWMQTSEADFYVRVKDGKFEVRKTLSRGQWGNSQDDAGRIYRNSNESVLHVDLVPTPYFSRNPSLLRQRGSYESLEGDNNEVNTVWPVRPTPGVNRGYQDGVLRADGSLSRFTSVCSPIVYRGDRLPKDLYGNVFVAEPAANVVSRIIVSDDGTRLAAKKAYEKGEFMVSSHERFRPVYLSSAPDGTIYVLDMYRGIIQHRNYITEYLRDQINSRDLTMPISRGRVWRIVHDTTKRADPPALSKATPAQLVQTLSHPNGWWRDTAQRLLVERGGKPVVPALQKLALSAPDPRTRMHALWVLDGVDAIDVPTVTRALADSSRDVRVAAIRISERWLGQANHPIQAAVLKRLDDQDWAVQEQLAASLGELSSDQRATALATLLERRGENPIVMDAALSGVRGAETALLDKLMAANAQTPARDAALTMITATLVRGGQDAALQSVFQRVADPARPEWQRSALLRGAEVSLLGTAMPGTAGRGRGAAPNPNAPCPTCPGGRQEPRGASAFGGGGGGGGGNRAAGAGAAGAPAGAAAEGAAAAGGGRGGRGNANGPALRLTREPAALSTLAGGTGDLSERATRVLARIEWPGKPGAAAPVTPLTPDEQKRFEAGESIYASLCVACHQEDGRGKEKMAPSLVGSQLALAAPGIPSRIVLNGKEGPVGLMPPLGQAFNDDQIAAVLTYIRRQWGNTASPVDAAGVKEIRGLTSTRTRPWTNEELLKLIGGQ